MLLLGAIGIAVTLPTVVITLLSLAVGQFGDRMPDGNRINYIIATERLKKLNDALQRYRVDCGRYPTPDEGLAALVLDYRTRGWRGPYLDEVPVDAWRRPYIAIYL
jgi:general secretion pathway protein G